MDGGEEDLDGGSAEATPEWRDGGVSMNRAQAENLLDSFKHSEKNLQPWRFQQRSVKKSSNGKDW